MTNNFLNIIKTIQYKADIDMFKSLQYILFEYNRHIQFIFHYLKFK